MSTVEQLFPRPEPKPLPDCRECIGWAAARERLRAEGNLSGVTDANIILRDHQRRAHGGDVERPALRLPDSERAEAAPEAPLRISELMRQTAIYEAPEPDPAVIAEGKATLVAFIDQHNAKVRRSGR